MRATKFLLLSVMAIPLLALYDTRAATDVSVGVEVRSANDFYEPLSTQGYWVEVGSYGRCWHPSYVESSWRPYCNGTWVWTDSGWYWQSDEPWGWACYHYGRWTYDPYYSWVWVPDTVWGPSWVVFREGGGYCGWAPLPPGGVVVVERMPANWFVFVGVHHFGERVRPRDVIVNNVTVINKTTIINRTRTVNKTVINEGPRVETLQRVNHVQIQKATVSDLRQREKVPPNIRRATQEQPQREQIIRSEQNKEKQQIEQKQKQIERRETVVPERERERPRGNPPEIIRGGLQSQPPVLEKREHVEPPPVEHKEQIEQRPSGPPLDRKVAPPPQAPPSQKAPPPQEDGVEEHGHGKEDEQGGRGR